MSIFSTKIISNNLLKENREELIEKISTFLFSYDEIKQVYIFGSFANNTHHNESDIDLLIVAKTDENFVKRNQKYSSLLEIYAPLDILVYTEEEFLRMKNDHSNGFWKKFSENHLLILDKS